MIRRALSFLRSLSGGEQCFLTLEGREQVAAIVDLFKWSDVDGSFTLRLTIHDRQALCAFINDGNLEFEVSPATVRGFAQYLLRRMREEGPPPDRKIRSIYRPKGYDDAEKEKYLRAKQ